MIFSLRVYVSDTPNFEIGHPTKFVFNKISTDDGDPNESV